ncbi:hypothetical protein AAMO2058_000856500 [Amorphochlora amoebiformis]
MDTKENPEEVAKITRTRELKISEGELQVDARDIPPGSFSNFFWLFSGGDSIRAKVWGTNRIESTRYTLYNFLPKNIFEQLWPWTKPANFYFLIIAIMQGIPAISTTQGKPTILLPLLFVVGVTMIKDWIEDSKRRAQDRQANEAKYQVYRNGNWRTIMSQDILVGDFVLIPEDGRVPCDIFVMGSGTENGDIVFVDTKDLDGETNLKPKHVPSFVLDNFPETRTNQDNCETVNLKIQCDDPDEEGFTDMGEWKGQIWLLKSDRRFEDTKAYVNIENFILRTCVVRNTPWVIGIAVYTGDDTKILKNQAKTAANLKTKSSTVSKHMNYGFLCMFCLQVIVCSFAAIAAGFYHARLRGNRTEGWGDAWYLALEGSATFAAFERFFTWFIICKDFLPISLYVSLEMVQFCQALFIGWDAKMAYRGQDYVWNFAVVQTSRLNEELAHVDYIFSDKTGTLTENRMDFKKCVVGKRVYGTRTTTAGAVREARLKNRDVAEALRVYKKKLVGAKVHDYVEFDERERLMKDLEGVGNAGPEQAHLVKEFLYALALNNSVFPKPKKKHKDPIGKKKKKNKNKERDIENAEVKGFDEKKEETEALTLDSSSPDEKALVYFAQYCGFEVNKRKETSVTIKRTAGGDRSGGEEWLEEFEDICLIDFSSKRKRMTVIVSPTIGPDKGKLKIYCKGADSYVKSLLRGSKTSAAEVDRVQPYVGYTFEKLRGFGGESLRTLVVAYATKPREWWFGDEKNAGWKEKYEKVLNSKGDNAKKEIEALEEKIERDAEMDLIGATAIEDKLQDGVPEAIRSLLNAQIKIWVLTGDNVATAVNIGISCNLLEADMPRDNRLFIFDDFDKSMKSLSKEELKSDDYLKAVEKAISDQHKVLDKLSPSEQKILKEKLTDGVRREFILKKKTAYLHTQLDDALTRVLYLKTKFAGKPLGLAIHGNVWKVVAEHSEANLDAEEEEKRRLKEEEEEKKRRKATRFYNTDNKAKKKGDRIETKFYKLATECKSVLGCRLEPTEKAEIVKLMQRREKKATLAIGDGNNDTVMIKTAEIGVGIRGVEGTSAVSASDYVISQFRFLSRLLLVHGRLNNRRICMLVYYMFYKASLIVWTIVFFGFYSAFSGQAPYLDWMFQLHNIAFTALPIIMFAIFDKDIEPENLEKYPFVYSWTRGPVLYGFHVFAEWAAVAFLHAAICFFTPWYSFEVTSPEESGQSFGFQSSMLVVYCAVVVVTNQKLAFYAAHWNWLWHLSFWGSISVLFGAILVFSTSTIFAIGGIDYFGIGFRLFVMIRFWITLILTSGLACMLDYSRACVVHFFPDKTRVFIEAVYLKKDIFDPDEITADPKGRAAAQGDFKAARGPKETYTGATFNFTPGVRAAYKRGKSKKPKSKGFMTAFKRSNRPARYKKS